MKRKCYQVLCIAIIFLIVKFTFYRPRSIEKKAPSYQKKGKLTPPPLRTEPKGACTTTDSGLARPLG
jgi:hypothetical protein